MKDNKYVRRLLEEWQQHGKIVIGLDIDDTIMPWRLNNQEECDKVINLLKVAKEVGAYLTVFTACNKDRYPEINNYCIKKGLLIDSINQNPISLPYGNQNKIYANIFIDDRAGLNESLAILEFCIYAMRSQQHSSSIQTVEF